jgi:hypothetical protein
MRIYNRFQGANPRRASDVEKLAPDRFLVRPWSEDGDGNYKFCLNVEVINETAEARSLKLLVDWEDLEYMDCRDYVLLGRDAEWTSHQGSIEEMVTTVELAVPPGEWYLGLHPVYDLEAFEDDCRRAVESGFEEQVYGHSYDGRELVALSAGPAGAPAVLVVSRFHPYETAGSHCVSSILGLLAEDLETAGELTGRFRFVIVPMPNPDGVAAGCCKRSRPRGPDLCHEGADSQDPAGRALAALLSQVAPAAYMDLHGWMYREHDGLNYTHPEKHERFAAALAGDAVFGKEWKGRCLGEEARKAGDFSSLAFHDHGAVSLVISPSWFGRSVPDMRHFGRKVLRALCGLL